MRNPEVFIIILNWNGWQDTIQCLESIFQSSYLNFQAVVLDNASDNNSVEKIREWVEKSGKDPRQKKSMACAKPKAVVFHTRQSAEQSASRFEENRLERMKASYLVLIQTGANRGFAGGNNIGIRYALSRGADYLLLLNNDAFFRTPDTLSLMVDFMEKNPDAGACGGRLFYPDGSLQQSYGHFPSVLMTVGSLFPLHKLLPQQWLKGVKRSNVVPGEGLRTPVRIDWPSGACLMARRSMIDEIGVLDEEYFLYMEETDWCRRMKSGGWERFYVPGAEVIHRFGGSPGNTAAAMLLRHLESRFIYYRRHFSRTALAVVSVAYLLRALWSAPLWTAAQFVLPAGRKYRAREQARYWRLAFRLSRKAMKNPVPAGFEKAVLLKKAASERHA